VLADDFNLQLSDCVRTLVGSNDLTLLEILELSARTASLCPPSSGDDNPMPTRKGTGEAGNVGALAATMNVDDDELSPLGIAHYGHYGEGVVGRPGVAGRGANGNGSASIAAAASVAHRAAPGGS